MDHRCDCERGGNCTRTTMCHVQSVVDDLNGEHEIEIERLQARVDELEVELEQWKDSCDPGVDRHWKEKGSE